MGVIKCPDCGGKVSDALDVCPHCGAPIESQNAVSTPAEIEPFPAKRAVKLSRKTVFGAAAAAVMLVAVVAAVVIASRECPWGTEERGEEGKELWCAIEMPDGSYGKHGPFREWHPSGQLKEQGTYDRGRRDGEYTYFYENGQMQELQTWRMGVLEGPATGWWEDGKKRSTQTFIESEPHGLSTTWHRNGEKMSECTYAEGKEHGTCIQWFSNGKKENEVTYAHGTWSGPFNTWHRNGQQAIEGRHWIGQAKEFAGRECGVWREWDKAGTLVKEEDLGPCSEAEAKKQIKELAPDFGGLAAGGPTKEPVRAAEAPPPSEQKKSQPKRAQSTDSPFGKKRTASSSGTPSVQPSVASSVVKGNLSKAVVASVLKRYSKRFVHCYSKSLARNPDLSGAVKVRIVISQEGTVDAVSVKGTTLRAKAVEDCVVGEIKYIRFPKPRGGGQVETIVPLVFRPSS